jgi:small subunit ribosomal protein S7
LAEEEKKDTKKPVGDKPEEKPQSSPQQPQKEADAPKESPVPEIPSIEATKTEKVEKNRSPSQAPPAVINDEKVKEEKKQVIEAPKVKKESPDEIPLEEIQEKKAEDKVKEEKEKTPEPKKEPSKESPKDKPKDKKEVEKVSKGDAKKPREKKGGDKEDRGKPRDAVIKAKDKKDELHTRFSPLIFGKYDLQEVTVEDPGLRKYINLSPMGLPHSGARHANKSFGKMKVNIVERLINNMMRTEHTTGKKSFTYKTVSKSFDIIAKRTKTNPVQVLINALQNSSPKEEITRLRFGGISVPKAVDTSSAHRLDVAIRNICKGAVSSSHKNKKRMALCLAEEIILASKADMNSFAISKKEEMERIASSAR